jgi:hypothetical protein
VRVYVRALPFAAEGGVTITDEPRPASPARKPPRFTCYLAPSATVECLFGPLNQTVAPLWRGFSFMVAVLLEVVYCLLYSVPPVHQPFDQAPGSPAPRTSRPRPPRGGAIYFAKPNIAWALSVPTLRTPKQPIRPRLAALQRSGSRREC